MGGMPDPKLPRRGTIVATRELGAYLGVILPEKR
jgi:hypothetical protein